MADPDAKQVVREVLSAMAGDGGDLGEMNDVLPELSAFIAELAAPEFVCAMVPIPPTPEVVYPGADGLERAWRDWGATFASVRAEVDEIRESSTSIVMLVRQIAITRHDGVEVTQPSAMVWKFDQGRVTRLEFHLDQTAALRAGGLE